MDDLGVPKSIPGNAHISHISPWNMPIYRVAPSRRGQCAGVPQRDDGFRQDELFRTGTAGGVSIIVITWVIVINRILNRFKMIQDDSRISVSDSEEFSSFWDGMVKTHRLPWRRSPICWSPMHTESSRGLNQAPLLPSPKVMEMAGECHMIQLSFQYEMINPDLD